MRNEHRVVPLSVPVKGRYGIDTDVYLSLPATLGRSGVRDVLRLPLDLEEEAKLRSSAAAIHEVQAALDFGTGSEKAALAAGAAATTTSSATS